MVYYTQEVEIMKRLLVIITVLAVLLAAPVVVKAATEGEVDLYQMVIDLLTRVDEQEGEIAILTAKIDELEEGTVTLEPEPAPEPEPEPIQEPETPPEPEPIQEPEPNPYAHLNVNDVHVATGDYEILFARWRLDVGDYKDESLRLYVYDGGYVLAFTQAELDLAEGILGEEGVDYTVSDLHVDPLFYQMVDGVKIGSRSEAIAYIEAKIAGN